MRPFDPRLLKYAKSARNYIAFLVLIGLLTTLLITVQTVLIAGAITPIFYDKGTISDTIVLILWLIAIFLLRCVLVYLQESIAHRAALRVISTLRTKVLRHAGDLGSRWLSDGNTARTVTLATRGLDDLKAYFVSFLPQLFLTVTAAPILIAVIFYLDWISAAAIILCIPLIPLFMILIGKMTAHYSAQRLQSMQHLGTQLLDLLAGIATLKAVGREKGPEKRVRALGASFAQKTMQTLYVAFLSGAVLEFLATLSTAIVAVEVGFRMISGNILLFNGLVIIMLTPEVFKPLREVGTQFHASANGVAAANKAFEIIETPLPKNQKDQNGKFTADSETVSPTGTFTPVPDLRQTKIRLENISMYVSERATVAPADLNAEIYPGKVTVLRGASGAGKSTTVQILMHLLAPSAGQVLVGDTPLAQIKPEDWWKQITWVPQRPVLIPGTVAMNLGVKNPENDPQLIAAAKLTGFDTIAAALPQGWQTLIGQGGVGLSVGQRQRLSLTRALLSKRQLVILDEPSAHLDAAAEENVKMVIQELKKNQHTVIVVAHRAALTKLADQIIDIHASSRDISAEIAFRDNRRDAKAAQERQAQENLDYALPASWGQRESEEND